MPIEYNIVRVFKQEKEEARAEGKAEGKAGAIIELLSTKGVVSETLKSEILGIADLELLSRLFTIAIQCQSMEEFVEQKSKI